MNKRRGPEQAISFPQTTTQTASANPISVLWSLFTDRTPTLLREPQLGNFVCHCQGMGLEIRWNQKSLGGTYRKAFYRRLAQLRVPSYPSLQELQQPPEDQEAILWVDGGEWSKKLEVWNTNILLSFVDKNSRSFEHMVSSGPSKWVFVMITWIQKHSDFNSETHFLYLTSSVPGCYANTKCINVLRSVT